jgi:hypothetical protein
VPESTIEAEYGFRSRQGKSTLPPKSRPHHSCWTLAEFSHQTTGSPWLENLEAHSIRGEKAQDGSWRARLALRSGNTASATTTNLRRITNRYNLAEEISHAILTQYRQLFKLGILLTELALWTQIISAREGDDPQMPSAYLVIERYGDDMLDANEVASYVESEINSTKLGDMVHFCLSSLQDRSRMRLQSFDDLYHLEMVFP